jgi:hypothetical protein
MLIIYYYICSPLKEKQNDSVAQLVEHYTFNVGVLGSNPSGITNSAKRKVLKQKSPKFGAFFMCLKISYPTQKGL